MKKILSKTLIATLLIGSMAGITTPAMATSVVPNSEIAVIENGEVIVAPCADEYETYYRTLNGDMQYRIWNATQGYWVNEWTYF